MRAAWVAALVLPAALVFAGPAAAEAHLVVTVQGGGSVASGDGLIACPPACSFTSGPTRVVTLTATPDSHSEFAGWEGCNGPVSGNVCVEDAESAPDSLDCGPSGCFPVPHVAEYAVTARFRLAQRTLTVTTGGPGKGSVSADTGGIVCLPACTGSYEDGTVVTLTASPWAGSHFAGWSGACRGKGSCVVTLSGADATAAATFALDPWLVAKRLALGRAAAGRVLTVRLLFERIGSVGAPTVTCRAHVGARRLVGRAALAQGAAVCSWRLPPGVRGRRVAGDVTVKARSAALTRSFSIRIR